MMPARAWPTVLVLLAAALWSLLGILGKLARAASRRSRSRCGARRWSPFLVWRASTRPAGRRELYLHRRQLLEAADFRAAIEADPESRHRSTQRAREALALLLRAAERRKRRVEFERPPRKVSGVVSTTARVGRAKRLPEEAFAPARPHQRLEPCTWLASPDPTMNVLPNGGVKICCCPAYNQREPLINIFEEDAAEFFRIYPRVRQEICEEIAKHAESGRFQSACEICNSLSHRAVAHEC